MSGVEHKFAISKESGALSDPVYFEYFNVTDDRLSLTGHDTHMAKVLESPA